MTHIGESALKPSRGGVDTNDDIAVRRLQSGDESALDDLYHIHATHALRTAYLITRNRATAEDVVQEAFLQVIRSITALRDSAAFRPWFIRIVVNAARRHARRGAFPLVQLDLTTHDKADPTSPTPDELAAGSAEIDLLRSAISELPETQRMPVILRYYSGLTDQEIGQTLGVPPGTVKSRLHSARKALELAMDRSLGRIKQQAARPARRPWFRSARGLAASVALAAAVAAGIIVMPSFGPNPNVVMAMTQAVDNLQRYHGVMTDGTEVWRDGDKFAVKYAQVAIPGALNSTVSDGNQAWAFNETTKHAVTYPLTGVEMAVQPNLRAIAGYALRNPHRTVGQETVSGRSTTKIEITPPIQSGDASGDSTSKEKVTSKPKPTLQGLPSRRPQGQVTTYHVWIDDETKLPLKWELPIGDGNFQVTGFTTFDVNPVIDPAVFKLPSADYTVEVRAGKAVATVAEAAAIAGFTPVMSTEAPVRIFASQGRIVLSYRDANIAQSKADGALQSDSNAAWGTAAGGPLRVDLRGDSLQWVQNGVAISASTTPGLSDHYIELARQIAPDLTLPAQAAGAAK